MPALPITGSKRGLSHRAALQLVKEKKADGYRAFFEYYPSSGDRKYQVIWY